MLAHFQRFSGRDNREGKIHKGQARRNEKKSGGRGGGIRIM